MTRSSESASEAVVTALRDRRANPRDVWGIPLGLPRLDKLTGGIHRNDFIVLGAETGAGKSVFAGRTALKVADYFRREGKGKVVRVVHAEMTVEDFQARLISSLSQVPIRQIQSGHVTDEEMGKVNKAALLLADMPIEYLEDPNSFRETEEFIRADGNCGFFIVDHLQVHPIDGGLSPMDARGAHELTKGFYRIAKSVAPGMGLSQLTNEVSKREDHRPNKGDLYGGKMIQANSSKILLLFDPWVYETHFQWEKKGDQERVIYIFCDKNRFGGVGGDKLMFEPSTLAISEAA
jgi:replicative DNA helicase